MNKYLFYSGYLGGFLCYDYLLYKLMIKNK